MGVFGGLMPPGSCGGFQGRGYSTVAHLDSSPAGGGGGGWLCVLCVPVKAQGGPILRRLVEMVDQVTLGLLQPTIVPQRGAPG